MIDLESTCRFCGQPLAGHLEHPISRDCPEGERAVGRATSPQRPVYRACVVLLRAEHGDYWPAESGPPDGVWCIQCGWHVHAHYRWAVLAVAVRVGDSSTEITPRALPFDVEVAAEFLGCPAD